jgi:hypothetical protein
MTDIGPPPYVNGTYFHGLLRGAKHAGTRLFKRAEDAAADSPNLVVRSVSRGFKYVGMCFIQRAKDAFFGPPEAVEDIEGATWIDNWIVFGITCVLSLQMLLVMLRYEILGKTADSNTVPLVHPSSAHDEHVDEVDVRVFSVDPDTTEEADEIYGPIASQVRTHCSSRSIAEV